MLPDWEVLPYDLFSPHPDIVSERLRGAGRTARLKPRCLLAAADTLRASACRRAAMCDGAGVRAGGRRNARRSKPLRARLVEAGYASVARSARPGEFALRGSLFDVFPMGADAPLRIDLFDEEIEAIRALRSGYAALRLELIASVRLLPARELPLDADAVKRDFRRRYRKRFEGDPTRSVHLSRRQ